MTRLIEKALLSILSIVVRFTFTIRLVRYSPLRSVLPEAMRFPVVRYAPLRGKRSATEGQQSMGANY
jgi:hypothetical protein